MFHHTKALSNIDRVTTLEGWMRDENCNELVPATSYGGLSYNNDIVKPFVGTVVLVVLRDEVLRMQSLDENRASRSNTNPLLSSGHGGVVEAVSKVEVEVWYHFH
jgi:hypothetical protein